MGHYLLFYEAGDQYLEQRAKFRSEHLAKAWKASQQGELVLAGAFADPVDGAVLLFKGESRSVAENFAKTDPYVIGGAVKRWYVREWTTVVGDQAATPVSPEAASSTQQSACQSTDSDHTRASPSILRHWTGRAAAAKAGDYVHHFRENVFPHIGTIPGQCGAYLLSRSVGNGVEFLVLTYWASMDAVRKFAGSRPEKAVVEPAARAALTDFDDEAVHYEIVFGAGKLS